MSPRRVHSGPAPSLLGRQGFSVKVNGEPLKDCPGARLLRRDRRGPGKAATPSNWSCPRRCVRNRCPTIPHRFALMWGPLVLAGDLGKELDWEGERHGAPSAPQPAPVFVAADQAVEDWLKPVSGRPGAFRTAGVGLASDIDMLPFYRVATASICDLLGHVHSRGMEGEIRSLRGGRRTAAKTGIGHGRFCSAGRRCRASAISTSREKIPRRCSLRAGSGGRERSGSRLTSQWTLPHPTVLVLTLQQRWPAKRLFRCSGRGQKSRRAEHRAPQPGTGSAFF